MAWVPPKCETRITLEALDIGETHFFAGMRSAGHLLNACRNIRAKDGRRFSCTRHWIGEGRDEVMGTMVERVA